MFIAHLPAAYLAMRALAPRPIARATVLAGLIGSIAPDLDLLWFYLVDNRQHHHHGYASHRPAIWLGLLVLGWLMRRRRISGPVTGFALGGLLHLALDSITGSIAWAWPLSGISQPLVRVPARYAHWVLNFLTHWTFLVEIALTFCAIALRARKNPGHHGPGSSMS